MQRKTENTTRMTRKRANESQQETIERKRENTARMRRKRANESQAESIKRDLARISAKRNIDTAIKTFHQLIQAGPIYVCTVCHRLMYKEGVQVFKYRISSPDLLQKVFAVKFVLRVPIT